MPVNMDPSKKRRKPPAAAQAEEPARADSLHQTHAAKPAGPPDEPTDRDRELALADAEWKNLWDATEVIDMDKW